MRRVLALPFLLAGCATVEPAAVPRAAFFARIQALCGKAYEGRVVTTDPADRDMASQRLVMHVRECSTDTIRIPFHVGADRSRTWIISNTPVGLLLKHDHRHEDGTEDGLSMYGGQTLSAGTVRRQEFPADIFTLTLFRRQGMLPNLENVWAVEIEPGRTFAYELRRPNRHVRVEFDLSRPITAPPPSWGGN